MKRRVLVLVFSMLFVALVLYGFTKKGSERTEISLEERIQILERELAELKTILEKDPGGDLKTDVSEDESEEPMGPRVWTEGTRGWDEDGTNDYLWTSDLNYSVGIGTATPSYKLDVTDDSRIQGDLYINSWPIQVTAVPTASDVLKWNGAAFIPQADVSGTTEWIDEGDYLRPADDAAAEARVYETDAPSYRIYGQYDASRYGYIGGVSYGVYGRYDADRYGYIAGSSRGVYGRYNATNYGYIAANGYGVYGRGSTYGVYGYGGVYGVRGYYNGSNFGYVGSNGIGVYGRGTTYGVYGYYSASIYGYIGEDSIAVYGRTDAAAGAAAAIKGYDNHDGSLTSPKGVIGHATSAANYVPFGVCGWTEGGYAYGVGGDFWGHGLNSIVTPNRAGCGVFGAGRTGVLGTTNTTDYPGVYGFTNASGPGVFGVCSYAGSAAYGVRGELGDVGAYDYSAVYGLDPVYDDWYGYGGRFYGGYRGVYGYTAYDGSYGVYGYEPLGGSGFAVYGSGDMGCSGAKPAVVRTSKGPTELYAMESPELWFEDFGSGQLSGGRTHIELDPLFLETVVIDYEYPIKVFITLTDECSGVYVKKGMTGFDVIELNSGSSSATFDYRVIAKRKGYEERRLFVNEAAYVDVNLYPNPNDPSIPGKYRAKRLAEEESAQPMKVMNEMVVKKAKSTEALR
jgi:hypothetical protein